MWLGSLQGLQLRGLSKFQESSPETWGNVMVTGTAFWFSQTYRLSVGQGGIRERSQRLSKLQPPLFPLAPASPLRKDLRSGRPPGPSAGGNCPNSSTPSGSDFPGFSFGFCGYREGAGTAPDPSPRADRGHPRRSAPAPCLPQPLVRTFLVASGLPWREEPGSLRGRPSASARRHSRYSGDLTKRA